MYSRIELHKKTLLILGFIVCVLAAVTYSFVSPRGLFSGLSNDLKEIESEDGGTYTDLDGNSVSLVAYKGKPLIVNSWASWIPFSKDELALLSGLKSRSGDEVTIIAINRMENIATIKAYLDFIGKPEGIVFLSDSTDTFYKAIQGYAMPETVFYDRDGVIVEHKRGVLSETELNTSFESIKAGK